jgi:hypothetical protein
VEIFVFTPVARTLTAATGTPSPSGCGSRAMRPAQTGYLSQKQHYITNVILNKQYNYDYI